jgi:hypothetical protein
MWWQPLLMLVIGPLTVFAFWLPWEIYKTRWQYRYLKERRTRRFRKMELTSPHDSKVVEFVDASFEAAFRASTRSHGNFGD